MKHEHRKNVILVNSLCNMIIAYAITNKMKPGEEFDLVLSDASNGLQELYSSGRLNKYFKNIYFVQYTEKDNSINRTLSVLCPEYGCKLYMGADTFFSYDNIYAYNPTPLFWYLQMAMKKNKISYSLHIYADALGVKDTPYEENGKDYIPCGQLGKKYVEHKYGLHYVRDLDYDYWIFSKSLFTHKSNRTWIDVPQLNEDDIDNLLDIFGAKKSNDIKEKFIYLDRCHEWNEELEIDALKIAVNILKDKLLVRKHPRQEMSYYRDNGIDVEIHSDSVPWEVYTMKDKMEGKYIISPFSAATLIPYIMFGAEYTLICMPFAGEKTIIDVKEEINDLLSRLIQENKKIFIAEDLQQFETIISNIASTELE